VKKLLPKPKKNQNYRIGICSVLHALVNSSD
jgi:hypothetical protein